MLNRSKLYQQVERISDKIFFDISNELDISCKTWDIICKDDHFQENLSKVKSPWLVPKWDDDLAFKKNISENKLYYQIIGVDGSQIYPDRHQGTSCFLINTGAVHFDYSENSKVKLFSEPHVFVNYDLDDLNLNDYVDCLREEFEFNLGLNLISDNQVLVFDGSLIFWHLMSKDEKLKKNFLKKYLDSFTALYESKNLYCSYISFPKNKELINLIRMQLSNFEPDNYLTKIVDKVTDADLMGKILEKNQRSAIFENCSTIVQDYPDELKPHFFYLNLGSEVGRVEVPKWIAKNPEKMELIERVVLDQCVKGDGYPVVLAEAHEQAVVKSADRSFFYDLLGKAGLNKKFNLSMSAKSSKKRKMTV